MNIIFIRKDFDSHTFLKAKDVFGNTFKGYTSSYGAKKRSGEIKNSSAKFSSSTAPALTEAFRNDAKPSSTGNSASIKWASYGSRVGTLAKMGRKVTDTVQPFPKKIIDMINSEVGKEIDRQFPKNKKVVINIKK